MGMRAGLQRWSLGLYPTGARGCGAGGAVRRALGESRGLHPSPVLPLPVHELSSSPPPPSHTYPPSSAALKWVMALFDVPEAIAVSRTAACAGGLGALTRVQAAGYYLGVLAYYW